MARAGTAGRPTGPVRPARTTGDVLRAAGAALALAVLVVGVPAALACFIGWPLPHRLPSLDTLRSPITSQTFVRVLAVVVWLAWAQFTACVLVETKAAVSGVGVPFHVPVAGPSQLLARQLVAALLLVGATAASLTPGLSQLGRHDVGPRPAGPAVTAQRLPGQYARQQAAEHTAAPAGERGPADTHPVHQGTDTAKATKFYRIDPPEGRHHDSLWDIAQRHLGDGRRYKEIYELNKDRAQPDGSRLSQASLIRPGWILEMPADARGGDLVEVPDPSSHLTPRVEHEVRRYAETGSRASAAQGTAAARDASGAHGGGGTARQAAGGGTAAAATAAGDRRDVPAATAAATASATAAARGDGPGALPEALIGSPLLAAGLLFALGRKRRTALLRSAAAGLRTAVRAAGTGPEHDADEALRIGADPDSVAFLDRALRALAAGLSDAGRPLPTAYAAWLSPDALHLQLASPDREPPAPWRLGQDQTFWRVDRADLPAAADGPAGTDPSGPAGTPADGAPDAERPDDAAPFPGLASLGTLDGTRLLLNLEAVPGIVTLSGAAADREAVLASLAAELATNGWSDRMTVTLVGFGERLTALAPTRMRHLSGLDDLVEAMTAETGGRRGALGTAGHETVLTGRTGRARHTQWAPHLVLAAAEPTDEQAERLAELAADSARLGIGYLIGTERSELPGTAWELEVTADGRLLAPLLGLELAAQELPRAQYDALIRLFEAADRGEPAGATDPAGGASPVRVDLSDQGRPAVYARLMGPFEVVGPAALDADRAVLAHEALALLLLHREGVHPRVLAAALWPRGVTEDVRDAVVDRVRDWLGADPDGTPRLSADDSGRLVLTPSVVSDWDVLQTLRHDAEAGGRRRDPSLRRRLLKDALALARGPLLAGRPAGRYRWLAHEIAEAQLPLLVGDVGLALAEEYLALGKAGSAATAVRAAMRVAPDDERLWLCLLRATHATGDDEQVRLAAEELASRSAHRGLPPRTQALLDELLPAGTSPDEIAN